MFIHQVEPSISAPAVLTVFLEDCPTGFKFDSTDRECVCNDLLNSRGIKCKASTHSLEVPAFTWIGIINGQAAVNEYCQYCHIERYVTIEMLENSDKLCSQNRTGILCGECIAKNSWPVSMCHLFSLQLQRCPTGARIHGNRHCYGPAVVEPQLNGVHWFDKWAYILF